MNLFKFNSSTDCWGIHKFHGRMDNLPGHNTGMMSFSWHCSVEYNIYRYDITPEIMLKLPWSYGGKVAEEEEWQGHNLGRLAAAIPVQTE